MTLDDYLSRRRGEARFLADTLGVTEVTVYRWRTGRAMPSHERIKQIEAETYGAVTPQDWFPSQESSE